MSESATTTGRGGGGGSRGAASATSVAESIIAAATSAVMEAAASATSASTGKSSSGHHGSSGTDGTSTNGTTTNSGKKNKGSSNVITKRAVLVTWYVEAGIIGAFFALYLFRLARSYMLRRRVGAARKAGATPVATGKGDGEAKLSRVPAAVHATYSNIAYHRVIPTWIWTPKNTAEWFWTAAYYGIVTGLGFWGSYTAEGKLDYANPTGYIAFGQIPIVVALASRNSILSWLTGVSYEKLNYLHRASSRICILMTWLHTLGWLHKGLGRHGPGTVIFLSGMLGSVACLIMWLTSFAIARKLFYETFLFIHITMGIIFIVASYYHWPRLGEWCWISLVLWAFDRVVSAFRMIINNKAWLMPFSSKRDQHSGCIVELMEPDVVRLTVNRSLIRWDAGQHAYITMPGVALARYEQHPMTLANIPDGSNDAVFIIRAQNGFTRRLVDRVASDKATDINCYLEGPYGLPHSMSHFDTVLLVVGGTGISFGTAHFLEILKKARSGDSAVSNLRLVWNVREARNVAWIAPMLNKSLEQGTGGVHVHIDIHVTRSQLLVDNTATSDASDSSVQSSPSASSENVAHSNKSFSPRDEKNAALAGLSPAAAAVVSWHQGRSDIEAILREDVANSAHDGAGVAVGVCGPTQLQLDVRRAVCRVNSADAVLRGQVPIEFQSESFGW